MRFLNQQLAQQIDVDLMSSTGGFVLEQLMELAGLSVAQAVSRVYSPQSHPLVLVCCGNTLYQPLINIYTCYQVRVDSIRAYLIH